MLEPGSLIAGKLRIEKILGQGGMGVVAVATHVGLEQRVAVKVLHGELAKSPEVVARFVREARAAAKLTSDYVCRVNDVGTLESGEPYIEMELLDGEDLAHVIARAPLAPELAAGYVVQACVAIAQAHAMGIVHRDLKPANLFLTHKLDGEPLVKVLDFGIATAPNAEDFKITKTSTVMGSPGYMSPEHLRSARDVDARSDIWSLGVILFEAVTAGLPFAAQSITELAVKVVMDEPAPITGVDPRYAAVVARCLRKPPEERYQSVAELAAALAEIAGPSAHPTAQLVARLAGGTSRSSAAMAETVAATIPPRTAPPGTAPTAPPAKPSTTLGGAASQPGMAAPAPKRKAALIALAVACVLGAAAAAFALVHRGGDAPASAPSGAPHPADAAIAARPPDAQSAGHHKLREKLHELADAKDYAGILVLADLAHNDPESAAIVADAKTQYIAEETKEIGEQSAHGDCNAAKLEAAEAHKLVPDEPGFGSAAAACAEKTKPAAAGAAPAVTASQAVDAIARGDDKGALAIAEQVLAKSPADATALAAAAQAECALHDAGKARADYGKLPAASRNSVRAGCARDGVDVIGADVTRDVEDALHTAQAALSSGDWRAAETAAKRAFALEPNNLRAIHALAVSACHTGDSAALADLRAKAPPRMQAALRHACDHEAGAGPRDRWRGNREHDE